MATKQNSIRKQIALETQKADDLQKLLLSLNRSRELQSQIEECTLSKLQLLQSTNEEINRMRHVIQELNKYITEPSASSLSFSPIVIASPDIDMEPIDLDYIPATFRPRRYSHIPLSYCGKYKMETIKEGNGVDFAYPNDKVTVQYTMFAIDGILHLMDSYVHEIIDLTSSSCMIGLKTGLLSMSVHQKCKLWIPRRLTAQYNDDGHRITHKCDVLVEVILVNIIRSDIFKEETYTNDIVLNALKPKRQRANTVSLTPPPYIAHAMAIEEHKDDAINMIFISGTKSMWRNTYGSLSTHDMIEQCMTLCSTIESCECTKRLLMIMKIYQSVMYNRKQTLWRKQYVNDELLSMYCVINTQLMHSNECIMNDFYHCRFYHGHFNRWYDFCRKHYEENYCVYEFNKCADCDGETTYKRHCAIYKRYHRNKLEAKVLTKRREWFRINHIDDVEINDDEINEIVTAQICDMIHCFIFHSSQEPFLMYARQYPLQSQHSRHINRVHTDKFTLAMNTDSGTYDGESFGVLISYKEERYTPLYDSMKDEMINNPSGISIYQYSDVILRANIFKQTFIGRQMVNFFGKHIDLQQIIAIMCYTNYIDLHRALTATLHCHNLDYDGMISLRRTHCESFWHWSKMLFSVVDNFGDPIENDCEFMLRFVHMNHSSLSVRDLSFYTECIYSATSDKLAFTASDNTDSRSVIAAIGAQRLGSLYFDASLLSDYPFENEILLGPSQHLEIRNLIINNHDNEIYFSAMYIMDALIGHKLSFDYQSADNQYTYLAQIVKALLRYIDGRTDELRLGQRICYEYWQNKANVRLNMKRFTDKDNSVPGMKQLIEYFLIENTFHFVHIIMLFPNIDQLQMDDIELNLFLCQNVLQSIQTLTNKDEQMYCGHKLNKIQLFGDENNKHCVDFVQNRFDEFVNKFEQFGWLFQIESPGNWLFTKR